MMQLELNTASPGSVIQIHDRNCILAEIAELKVSTCINNRYGSVRLRTFGEHKPHTPAVV